jgi:pimeloyl-ACP methyl ester carboxylesterase
MTIAAWVAVTHPPNCPYSTRGLAEDAVAILDHLGLERAHVFGVSMGGPVGSVTCHTRPRPSSQIYRLSWGCPLFQCSGKGRYGRQRVLQARKAFSFAMLCQTLTEEASRGDQASPRLRPIRATSG